jgi:hypothetical protein
MKKLFYALVIALISFSSCESPKEKEFQRKQKENWSKAKEHLYSTDDIIQTERGGYYIVENGGKYYRVGPSGTRSEVKRVYR